ncbi:MAG: hypothetical protein WKF82_08910 [Nocardioidaceae bacterium]
MLREPELWHVTVTVTGQAQPLSTTKAALDRLQGERPFLHSIRYDEDKVELAYWEEAPDVVDAASLALRLWNEHRDSAELPTWRVVGLRGRRPRHLPEPKRGSGGRASRGSTSPVLSRIWTKPGRDRPPP